MKLVRPTENMIQSLAKMLDEEPEELYQTKEEMLRMAMKASRGMGNPKTFADVIDVIWEERW